MIKESIFRKYDIRGVVGQDLMYDDASNIASAFSVILKRFGINKISLGRDGRLSSEKMHENFIKSLVKSGISVVDIGLVPSPCLYFSIYHLNLDAAIVITGSHNPKEYNGFKFTIKGRSFFDEDIKAMYHIIQKNEFLENEKPGTIEKLDIRSEYVEYITSFIDANKMPKVAFDAGNGAGGEIVKMIAKKFKIPNENLIFCDIDGNFPNHHPDPTQEKNMKDISNLVLKNGCDIGIAFDGDADRIGIVDDKGRFVFGDILVCILAKYILLENGPGTIIADVKSSKVLFDEIKKCGGNGIMYKTGHAFIKDKMKKEKALLAGEMSGHIFYADRYFGFDDGIYTAMRLIEILQKYNVKISDLIDSYPKMYNTPEIKIDLPEEIKFQTMDKICEVLKAKYTDHIDIDGIRVNFENGWMLIRASNTQNCLVGRIEADSEDSLNQIKTICSEIFEKFDLKIEF